MHKLLRVFVLIAFVATLLLSVSMTGCSRHPNEKQCQAYEEQKEAAAAAEKLVQDTNQEKAMVQEKLTKKQAELASVKSEKEKVKSKIGEM